MSTKQCPICLLLVTVLNKHHVVPKCYGGLDKAPLLELCENCHKAIHYTAEDEYAGNIDKIYLLPDQLQRARPYIEAIKKAKFNYEQSPNSGHISKKVMLVVPEEVLVKMHKRKSSLGFKALDKYLRYLVEKDLKNL
jgi:hypothetical protein